MTLDTNILIAYFTGDEGVVSKLSSWQKDGGTLFLPSIVEAELLSFPKLSTIEQRTIEKFLEENLTFIPFDRTIARIVATIRRQTNTKIADSAIAATALYTRTPLATRNTKDFKNVAGLTLLPL
ncbi:type II toxin-antitoxin system VapC family toxin [Candidatus Uhrbacteria bacterium]|nr:type II toxin-antitoxin system VapC family toxin [Candidatus Uhrbacteria bacterium]